MNKEDSQNIQCKFKTNLVEELKISDKVIQIPINSRPEELSSVY